MATKEKDTNKELEVEEIVSKSEQFIENNSKKIIYGIIAVALVVGAVLGIKHGYLVPQEKKAAAAMFKGEQYFARDSFALALNGNGENTASIPSRFFPERGTPITGRANNAAHIPGRAAMKVSRLSSTNMEARTPETWRRLTQVSVTTRWAIHRRRSIY